jgi:hypothetical protein
MRRYVELKLTPLQAECLLQLAQEADLDTFTEATRWRAGIAGMDKLVVAMAREREGRVEMKTTAR